MADDEFNLDFDLEDIFLFREDLPPSDINPAEFPVKDAAISVVSILEAVPHERFAEFVMAMALAANDTMVLGHLLDAATDAVFDVPWDVAGTA